MADQTHGAVDSLLGILSAAVKDEARLLGGVHGDVQFIKDEMDSMNGFLLHLTKTESEHDDQQRAWMKQVLRDIAYIAEDCIELYMRDLAPTDGDRGILAFLRHLPVFLWTAPARHRLATRIRELKVRVRDVGERRLRYGVNVPEKPDHKRMVNKPPVQDDSVEEARKAFLHALEEDVARMLPYDKLAPEGAGATSTGSCPSFREAISLLPGDLPSEAETIRSILEKCYPGDDICMKMFLCALFVYPYATNQELINLNNKLKKGANEPKEIVKIFCYSMLTTQQKSCLQYLTAFLSENSISRTSLVRRWVAEGFVAKEPGRTAEEAGERCFSELVFRGFIRPDRISEAGTVKSCLMEGSVKDFIINIAKSENFVADLPVHLDRQLNIRKMVERSSAQHQQQQQGDRGRNIRGLCCGGGTSTKPVDDIVDFLKLLPETYRLNVLDLGGCRGLKKRHLKSICRVTSLKYLSLRNTDVTHLPARRMQALKFLETLDIRETNIPPGDTKHIFVSKLKHLLAGRRLTRSGCDEDTAQMPARIGTMIYMETLSRVQVSRDGADLEGVAKLPQLRKLGVVLHGNDDTAKHLCRVMTGLAQCLRSLSIWVDGTLEISVREGHSSFSASGLILENLDIKGKMVPRSWMEELKKLANITLRDTELEEQDLRRLGQLPGLRSLRLRLNSYCEQVLNFTDGQFKALKFLVLEDGTVSSIAFAARTAPVLEKIVWTFLHKMGQEDLISGINFLPNLKVIELREHNFNAKQLMKLDQATAEHPKRPALVRVPRQSA